LQVETRFPEGPPRSVILMVSGITGVDPEAERGVLEILTKAGSAVVLMQPGRAAWSKGRRGDIDDLRVLLGDYADLCAETARCFPGLPVVLFGHSMGGAFALATAAAIQERARLAGVVLVNPAYRYRAMKGATPRLWDYLKFAAYALFAPSVPVVDMGGDPARFNDPEDRAEAIERRASLRLTHIFSLRTLIGARKIMAASPVYAGKLDLPLFMVEGGKDRLIDPAGTQAIFKAWEGPEKMLYRSEAAGHGRSAILAALPLLIRWIADLSPVRAHPASSPVSGIPAGSGRTPERAWSAPSTSP
jgi:alpha-beta hydrolase superfamily lysophospholipase